MFRFFSVYSVPKNRRQVVMLFYWTYPTTLLQKHNGLNSKYEKKGQKETFTKYVSFWMEYGLICELGKNLQMPMSTLPTLRIIPKHK